MSSTTDTALNLATLEEVLLAVHDQAKRQYPFLAQVLSEAVTICQSRHAVHGGINLQLQAALASIREGRPEDATRYIELALDIEDRWNGGVTQGLESTGGLQPL